MSAEESALPEPLISAVEFSNAVSHATRGAMDALPWKIGEMMTTAQLDALRADIWQAVHDSIDTSLWRIIAEDGE